MLRVYQFSVSLYGFGIPLLPNNTEVKKPRWITIGIAVLAVVVIYAFGRTDRCRIRYSTGGGNAFVGGAGFDGFDPEPGRRQIKPDQQLRINQLKIRLHGVM